MRCFTMLIPLLFAFGCASAQTQHGIAIEKRTQLSAGAHHSCAVRDGKVFCWGENAAGQLGNGSTQSSLSPVSVPHLDQIVEIEAGDAHTCARRKTGEIFCWGSSSFGQTGGNLGENQLTPGEVFMFMDTVALSTGKEHTCGVSNDGNVTCFGCVHCPPYEPSRSLFAQVRAQLTYATHAREVAAGDDFTCVRSIDNRAECWGRRLVQQTNTLALQYEPFRVFRGELQNFDAGFDFACAQVVRVPNQVMCWDWGDWDSYRILNGNRLGTISKFHVGQRIGFMLPHDAAQIAVGKTHACARGTGGDVSCFGYFDITGKGSPRPVEGLHDAIEIAAGEEHLCAMRKDRSVVCWGKNTHGQLGDGTTDDRMTPKPVVGLP